MADLIFYTNPHVARADRPLDAGGSRRALRDRRRRLCASMHDADYRAVNPMMKVPAIVHNGKTVTEVRGDLRLSRRRLSRRGPRPARRRKGRLLPLAVLRRRARSSRRSPTMPSGWDPIPTKRPDVRLRHL